MRCSGRCYPLFRLLFREPENLLQTIGFRSQIPSLFTPIGENKKSGENISANSVKWHRRSYRFRNENR